ncbi:nematode cuticle collagen domain protein, partial [Oesophagostomum dentatum]
VAFVGVAISTVATLVCVVSVPLLYNYMQHMQSVMQSEVDFCKSRSGNIWREITRTQLECAPVLKVDPRLSNILFDSSYPKKSLFLIISVEKRSASSYC